MYTINSFHSLKIMIEDRARIVCNSLYSYGAACLPLMSLGRKLF